jgi:hypothetical protein
MFQKTAVPSLARACTKIAHERSGVRYKTRRSKLLHAEPTVSEAVALTGYLKMVKANAKSQEPASEGIGEKGRQINRQATAIAQEKRSRESCHHSEAR